MEKKPKRILIINTFGIGDVLFSTPMTRSLKRQFPDATIDFICNKRCEYITRNNKNINDVILFEKDEFREALSRSKREFADKLLTFFRTLKRKRYDLAIDLSLGYHISLLLWFSGVKQRLGLNYRKRGRFLTGKLDIDGFDKKHVVEYYLDILKLIGIETSQDKRLELDLPDDVESWANNFVMDHKLETRQIIGVAPGGGKSWGRYAVYRRWDPKNFSFVAEELARRDKNIFVLIFGSREEKDMCGVIKEKLGEKALDLCGELPLSYSIALIKKCHLLLCNDGGLLHTAVSQDVNTISIFGPVDDTVYGPYPISDRHRVVKAEGIKCRPCYRSFKPKVCTVHDCLKKIERDKVLKLAKEILVESSTPSFQMENDRVTKDTKV